MTPARRRAVLMNDTRDLGHAGCRRVMRLLEEHLARRGIVVTARSRVRAAWDHDRRFLKQLSRCDVVVINGEGTLHHGGGRRLLEVVAHPARGTTPVALVNALYQANPPDWAPLLDRLSLVVARDSWSAGELGRTLGRPVDWSGDISLADGFVAAAPAPPRAGIVVGDSVFPETTARLAALAKAAPAARFVPMQPPERRRPEPPRAARLARWRVGEAWAWLRHLGAEDAAYLRCLRSAALHVTGRFHGVCLSLITRTPLLALASNSWKVEAVLEDLGIAGRRLVRPEDLTDIIRAGDGDWAWTAAEARALEAGVARSTAAAARMFDTIRNLADTAARP